MPEWVFEEMDDICFNFLWRGRDKIKRGTLSLEYKQGGLKMINFRLFVKIQKVMWIKRLVTGNQKIKWKTYFKYLMRQFGGNFIFLL